MSSRAKRPFPACTSRVVVSGAALVLTFSTAGAQAAADAPPGPCHELSCGLNFDWGSGKTAASFGPDRRYGSGDDFESRFRGALGESGYRVKDPPASGPLLISVRPIMRAKAMCDQMSGTNTDMSCTAMSDVTIAFQSTDPAAKAPGSVRVTNRCGANDTFMTMAVFAKYAADMVYWTLEGQAKKMQRPTGRC